MIEALPETFVGEFLTKSGIARLPGARNVGGRSFPLSSVERQLCASVSCLVPGCLRSCFLANFGTASNSLWEDRFRLRRYKRGTAWFGQAHFRKRRNLPEHDCLTAQSHTSQSMNVALHPATSHLTGRLLPVRTPLDSLLGVKSQSSKCLGRALEYPLIYASAAFAEMTHAPLAETGICSDFIARNLWGRLQ